MAGQGAELPPATQRAAAYIRARQNLPRELIDAELARDGYLQATRAQAWAAVDRPGSGKALASGRLVQLAYPTAVIFPVTWALSFVALSLVWGVIREVMRQTGVPADTTRTVTGLLAVAVFVLATVVAFRVSRRAYRRRVSVTRTQRPTIGR